MRAKKPIAVDPVELIHSARRGVEAEADVVRLLLDAARLTEDGQYDDAILSAESAITTLRAAQRAAAEVEQISRWLGDANVSEILGIISRTPEEAPA